MAAGTPYALGRFRARTGFGPRADDFTGVVVGEEVAPLAALLPAAADLDALLDDWPANAKLLGDVIDETRGGQRWAGLTRPAGDFARLAPLRPGQIFPGVASAICGPDDNVVLPDTGTRHDWALELGVVIGREAYRVSADDALRHVAGYVIANDLTTCLPLGPWLVPAVFVPDPAGLRVTLKLNGETVQDETTAGLVSGVPELVAHVSATTPLRPGDLLLTGSPGGNGARHDRHLRPGDVMEATITGGLAGLGAQRNRCVAP
jgi:2-keto-4-pentenoate hydratase/2-oxohepta-3-ene-1,7-dioic acid hydratase in catechol pathway